MTSSRRTQAKSLMTCCRRDRITSQGRSRWARAIQTKDQMGRVRWIRRIIISKNRARRAQEAYYLKYQVQM